MGGFCSLFKNRDINNWIFICSCYDVCSFSCCLGRIPWGRMNVIHLSLCLLYLTLHYFSKVEACMKSSIMPKWCAGLKPENEELLELFLMSTCIMKNISLSKATVVVLMCFLLCIYCHNSNLLHLMLSVANHQNLTKWLINHTKMAFIKIFQESKRETEEMKCLKVCNMNSWAMMKVSVWCLDLK